MGYLVLALLIAILQVHLLECFNWDLSAHQLTVHANHSAIIKFRYVNGAENRNTTRIDCGILETNQSLIIPIVSKYGIQEAQRRVNVTGDVLGSKATLYTNPQDPTTIGFSLRDVDKSFPTRFQCSGIYQNQNGESRITFSPIVKLSILNPPKFNRCLENIQLTPVTAGNSLEIACQVIGNPSPNLKCELLDYDKRILNTSPKRNGQNLDKNDIGSPNNISASFTNLPKEAHSVRCIASNKLHGVISLERKITVNHTPFQPKNFSQENSTDRTSIRVSWKPLVDDEWGGDKDKYIVAYFMVGQDQKSNLTAVLLRPEPKFERLNGSRFQHLHIQSNDTNATISEQSPTFFQERDENGETKYFYTIKSLNPQQQYQVWVYAQNRYGKGDESFRLLSTPGLGKESTVITKPAPTNYTKPINATNPTTRSGSTSLHFDIRSIILCNLAVLYLMLYRSN